MAGEWRGTAYGEFAAEFVDNRLANLCVPSVGIQTGPFGSQLHQHDYVAVGTPIITVEHLGANRILHEGVPRVSDADRQRLSRYSLRAGDIVFSRVGSVDRRALVRRDEDGWLFSGRCLRVRPDPVKVDSGFLSYFFGLPEFQEHIRAIAVGATMPSLNTQLLSDVVIPHPRSVSEQRRIAHILGTLDDKIELNRRMNETLEAMARALFQSWFIDFDPVRRNAARSRNQPSPDASRHPLPLGEDSSNLHYRGTYRFTGLVETSRALRNEQTSAENFFWELVRDRRQLGLKFRRQHQIGDYIADFYCHEHRLVVELDGGVHSTKQKKDHKRDTWLQARGFTVLRFSNEQLLDNPEFVLAAIAQVVESAAQPLPLPLGEGRGEGSVEELDRLFPDSFEDSELGEIPKGWRVGTLGDVAEHSRRGVQPNEIEPSTPYIALEHMPRRCIALSEWGAADGLESNKFKFKIGEILFGKLRPYFHKVGVAPVHGVCSTDIVVVSPHAEEWFGFVLGHVSSDAFVEHTTAGSTGTKMPRTSWSEMARYAAVIPPENVAKAFTSQIRPTVDHIIASIHESRTLAALRDTLLPKLISGELRVKDAERLVGRGPTTLSEVPA